MAVNRNRCLVQTKKREKAKFLLEGRDPMSTKVKDNLGHLQKEPYFQLD